MKKYIYSDLFLEKFNFEASKKKDSASDHAEMEQNGVKISRITVRDDLSAQKYGCKKGTYITVSGDLLTLNDSHISDAVADQLRYCLNKSLEKPLGRNTRILVAGLGNIDMTADSVGPRTVKKIAVTGHISGSRNALWKTVDKCTVFALSAGVMGDTGMESAQIVKAVARECEADAIIAVDSLAAGDSERLIRTVQISDNGISPGSGIYNARREISARTTGIPVIAIGVPTVINSATLVSKTLEDAGINKINDNIEQALESQRRFFVAPKDIDITVRALSSLLADAIDKALTVEEYNSDPPNIL